MGVYVYIFVMCVSESVKVCAFDSICIIAVSRWAQICLRAQARAVAETENLCLEKLEVFELF